MASTINALTGSGGVAIAGDSSGILEFQSNGTTVMTVSSASQTTLNRIINGDMTIDQRNAGASATLTNTGYSLDRWQTYLNPSSKYTVQQNAGSVTPPVGFTNYLGVTSTSAYSVSAGDYNTIAQPIEGYNIADLGFGTANAKTVTLSFWVRSSLTGTFGGALASSGGTRTYPFTYTISVADTWEQKSVTIAGDTSGTWLTTSGVGLTLQIGLGVGTTYSGTAGSWAGTNYLSATGATSVVGTSGATFYITGVQLEAGGAASNFEQLQYGQQLALCQRYYYATTSAFIAATATTLCYNLQFPVTMRATPTETHEWSGVPNDVYNIVTAATPTFVPDGNFPINTGMKFAYDFSAGLTAGQPYQTEWTFSAEL